MPAEIQVASGSSRRTTAAGLGQPVERLRRRPRRVARPPSRRAGAGPRPPGSAPPDPGSRSTAAPDRPVASGGSRLTWTRQSIVPVALLGSTAQPADQLGPVDGVHGVGVAGHGRCLVALQRTDEVPAQAEVCALGRLLDGLLVPVLPHVA